jgi:hypothetical protein
LEHVFFDAIVEGQHGKDRQMVDLLIELRADINRGSDDE